MRFAAAILFVCLTFFSKGQQSVAVVNLQPDTIHLCNNDEYPLLDAIVRAPQYEWYLNDVLVGTEKTYQCAETGVYIVKYLGNDTPIEKTIVVDRPIPYPCETIIPNVFTPNADGKNDVFTILNIEHYPNSTLYVYARWGRKVFESRNYHNELDGLGQDDGTYYFVFKRSDGQEFKGSVTILR